MYIYIYRERENTARARTAAATAAKTGGRAQSTPCARKALGVAGAVPDSRASRFCQACGGKARVTT